MSRLARLLAITFIESYATILIERGVYFFSHERLRFTDTENLWLALAFGAAYAGGALASHATARLLAERRLLLAAVGCQTVAHGVLVFWHGPAAIVVINAVLGCLNGLKWPVVESYVSAGRTPADQARVVGHFNLAWASAVPLSLLAAGPLIGWSARGLFAAAAVLNVASLLLVWPLEPRPVHLPADHPERPAPQAMARYAALLASARWSMLCSYALMWILAAVLPGLYAALQVDVRLATALSGLLDVVRFLAFLLLQLYRGWHRRGWPLALVVAGLPVGFFVTIAAPNLATVLAGEVIFGVAAGMTYYAALYYAMVVKNASVDAGGAHEGLIGSGFALGPLAGLAGRALAPALGGPVAGMAAGVAPVVLVCSTGAAWFLRRLSASPQRPSGVQRATGPKGGVT